MVEASSKPQAGTRRRRTSASAKRGLEIRRELYGHEDVDRRMAEIAGDEFMNTFFDFTHEVCFDQLWGRKGLSDKSRSMITLAIVAAKNETAGLRRHVRGALRNGLSKKEIAEILLHVYVYSGVGPSLVSFTTAAEEFAVIDAEKRAARKKGGKPRGGRRKP
jgi:4-carboxymuconolactone decarboxylase